MGRHRMLSRTLKETRDILYNAYGESEQGYENLECVDLDELDE